MQPLDEFDRYHIYLAKLDNFESGKRKKLPMKKKIWGAYGFLCAVLLLMAASSFLRKRVTYEMGVNLHVTEGEVKEGDPWQTACPGPGASTR